MSHSADASLTSADEWLRAASYRRSIYGLKGTSSIPDARIEEIVKHVQSFAPSAYNTQPVRITLATERMHKGLWDAVSQAAEPVLRARGDKVWNSMQGFLVGHKAAYGSIVFWESEDAQQQGIEAHKSNAQLFPQYGDHASGMSQLLVWTALELEGLGANLQHMQSMPQAEAAMKAFCDVPETYHLKAHIVYGDKPRAHPETPPKLPFTEVFNRLP